MKNDDFLHQGRRFDKWVIVGHWPVVLYGGDITCADPLIDRESHIVSIDGGCVLKDDGQLNALIIPRNGSEDFGCVYYDPFPLRRVKTAQAASQRSAYIRWGDNVVEVLERGRSSPAGRHLRTGYELDILTKYLRRGSDGAVRCNDCTDYVLPLALGDEVGVVETTSRGYLVKHNGVSGWYFGRTGGRGMIVLYCLLGAYLLFINIDGFALMAVGQVPREARRPADTGSDALLRGLPRRQPRDNARDVHPPAQDAAHLIHRRDAAHLLFRGRAHRRGAHLRRRIGQKTKTAPRALFLPRLRVAKVHKV